MYTRTKQKERKEIQSYSSYLTAMSLRDLILIISNLYKIRLPTYEKKRNCATFQFFIHNGISVDSKFSVAGRGSHKIINFRTNV